MKNILKRTGKGLRNAMCGTTGVIHTTAKATMLAAENVEVAVRTKYDNELEHRVRARRNSITNERLEAHAERMQKAEAFLELARKRTNEKVKKAGEYLPTVKVEKPVAFSK